MDPMYEAVLFLLRRAHASGNHPDGEAQRLIEAVESDYTFLRQHGIAGQDCVRVIKKYPCGCQAGPGPANMPDYCPQHDVFADRSAECRTVAVLEPQFPSEQPDAVDTEGRASEDTQSGQPETPAPVE